MAVRPDLHGARGLPLITEGVHVTDDRIANLVVGLGEDVHGAHVGHLVDGGNQRNGGTGHVGDAVGPDATGHDHVVGLDGAFVGHHGLDGGNATLALGSLDIQHFGVGEDLAADRLNSFAAHGGARLERVHHRHRRTVEAAENHFGIDERHQFLDLGGGQHVGLDAPCLG